MILAVGSRPAKNPRPSDPISPCILLFPIQTCTWTATTTATAITALVLYYYYCILLLLLLLHATCYMHMHYAHIYNSHSQRQHTTCNMSLCQITIGSREAVPWRVAAKALHAKDRAPAGTNSRTKPGRAKCRHYPVRNICAFHCLCTSIRCTDRNRSDAKFHLALGYIDSFLCKHSLRIASIRSLKSSCCTDNRRTFALGTG